MRKMEKPSLWAIALVVGTLALAGLAAAGPVEIPLPEGAFMRLGMGQILGNVIFSPDGRYLAVGTSLGVELRDTGTMELVRFFSRHTSWVNSVAFSPDGKILASGSDDETIKLWDVATGRELRTLSGHTGWVESVAFSPDGKVLASGSGDGTVLLWDLSFLNRPPQVLEVMFPTTVFTGTEAQGTVRFADPNADLVRAEFTVLEGPFQSFALDLTQPPYAAQVQGKTEGSFTFTLKVDQPGTYRLRVTLVDAAGLRSEPHEFSFQAKIPTPPKIVRITFPEVVKLGQEGTGFVRYEDPDGDIAQAEFTVVEGDPATITVSPDLSMVQGSTSGSFRFTVVATQAQTVVLRLVLVDSAGLRSDPMEFTFRVE